MELEKINGRSWVRDTEQKCDKKRVGGGSESKWDSKWEMRKKGTAMMRRK